ncbi:hypothetical protein WJU23_03570 [Prosthecobacter sp. SYSU 5D2]|uniref:hypothetical protein n=1 Tax=Prosthecobacter sp. SYSU 5D2 TaxID=3134134 RepID=UPI0031FF427D
MKALRLSLLSALLGSTAAMGAAIPADMAGSYQALISSETSPYGLLALKVSTKGAVSGKLTTSDKKTYSLKTTLDYTAGDDPATEGEGLTETGVAINAAAIAIKGTSYTLELKFRDFADRDTLEVTVKESDATVGLAMSGFKVKTYAKGETVPTLGSYTVAFELAADVDGAPEGSGYAVAKVDAKGVMKLAGKLGDGTKITATLPNGPDNQFVFFTNPYKRDGSFFGGRLAMTARDGGGFHVEVPNDILLSYYDAQWKKAAGAKDKSYRDGFGPLSLLASAEPWAPEKKTNVATYLGLDEGYVFDVALSGDIPTDRLPVQFTLDAKNNLVVTKAHASAPNPVTSDDWKKILKGKVDIKTGKVTITITLGDKRKVVIEGVVLLPEGDELATFTLAPGFVMIPPVDKKTGTISYGALQFQGPFVIDPLLASAAATAGTYNAVIKEESNTVPPASGTVTDGETIKFTISPDLKTLTIDGKKMPLVGDSRPISLGYVLIKGMNSTSVIMYLDESGTPTGFFLTYAQPKLPPKPSAQGVFSSDQITKLP